MRKHKLKHIALLILIPLASTACNPADVQEWGRARGISISEPTAQHIAERLKNPSIESMIRDQWPGTQYDNRAVAIAKCESGLNPSAKNRTSSASGVFQLIKDHWGGKFNPFDAYQNIRYAYRLWDGGNKINKKPVYDDGIGSWKPWVCKG